MLGFSDRGHVVRGLLAVGALVATLLQLGVFSSGPTRRLDPDQVPIDLAIVAAR